MLFHSLPFLLFVAVVALVHRGLPAGTRARSLWLLAASWFFYATWSPPYLALLILVTAVDFALAKHLAPAGAAGAGAQGEPDIARAGPPAGLAGRGADVAAAEGRRRRLLVVAIAANLLPLLLFKYARFFWEQVAAVAPLPPPPGILRFAVPIGISFYTFHALSYVIDVYRGVAPPSRRFDDLALYLAFFPKIVAGPITRWGAFAPQIARPAGVGAPELEEVAFLLVRGLVKKVVLADALGTYVDPVYADLGGAGAGGAAFAFYAYPFQLYLDFSGYTDVARALARLFGYALPENFDHPYLARGPADYWRRWNITLSTWLRDYLFFPILRALDRRRGPAAGNAALAHVSTMLLSGLWHGAGWNFVSWGGLHGVWLGLHRTWIERFGRRPRTADRLRWIGAFHAIAATLVVFRAPTLAIAGDLFTAIARLAPAAHPVPVEGLALLALAAALHVAAPALDLPRRWSLVPAAVQGVIYGVAIALIAVFSGKTEPFIYFQF